MAKYKGPINISGTIGDLTFQKDGTVKLSTGLDKKKFKNKPNLRAARDNAQGFGGAIKCASALFRRIPAHMRALARNHAHNFIAVKIRMCNEHDTRKARKFDFEQALPALHHLNLSRSKILAPLIKIHTLDNPLQPSGIRILGLRDAADAIPPLRNHTVKLRIHFACVVFPETVYDEEANEWKEHASNYCLYEATNWLSPTAIPENGLRLALKNTRPEIPQVLFLAIEWRHSPQEKKQSKAAKSPDMREWGIVRVAALIRPVQSMDLPIPAFMQSRQPRHYKLQDKHYPRTNLREISSRLALRLALPFENGLDGNFGRSSFISYTP